MKQWFRQLFYYNRQQQIAIITLLIIIMLTLITIQVCKTYWPSTDRQTDSTFLKQALLFRDTLRNYVPMKQTYPSKTKTPSVIIQLQPFDPNTADSITLLSVGLNPFMARNLIRYRNKGGRFKDATQLEKLFGMTPELFKTIEPYIQIGSNLFTQQKSSPTSQDTLLIIELNSADTAQLKQLIGIGVTLAQRIVDYRDALGGYYHINQLSEIYGIDSLLVKKLSAQLTVNTDSIRPIAINRASIERLKRHPYINFYQAKAIYEKKQELRYIRSLKTLQELQIFNDSTLHRLAPYLNFDIPDYKKKKRKP